MKWDYLLSIDAVKDLFRRLLDALNKFFSLLGFPLFKEETLEEESSSSEA
ncbi:MAG: hypothetical protein IKL10_03830 [Clostridia bacterium]|nr:hypothetical protein [Clostridia bacterium]